MGLRRLFVSRNLSRVSGKHIPGWAMMALLGLSITGCNVLMKLRSPEPETQAVPQPCAMEQCEAEREKLLAEKEVQHQEIERLQKLVAEKDAFIRSQQARQQDQAKTLQETNSQVAHAQIKLRRLATRPGAASTIAESEISLGSLRSSPATHAEQLLQTQAERLLAAATASYAEENYAAAMDQAAQAREFIDMVKNSRIRKTPGQIPVSLKTPILLRAIADSNLRQKPGLKSAVLGVLKKDSTMTAEAYQGDWLQIQTIDGRSGWVLNTLVEAQAGKP